MTQAQVYYTSNDNSKKPYIPFDRLYALTHFIMPNFGTMNWDGQTRDQVNTSLKRLQHDTGALNDKIMMYIHIPYCKSLCHYCNFNKNSYPKQGQDKMEMYVDYLIKEIDFYLTSPYIQAREFTGIYIGGGSPSTLPVKALERLFDHLAKSVPNYDSIEKTFTGEARTLSRPELLQLIKDYKWDRVTFGIETFNEEIHRKIGRRDTRDDIDAVFNGLKRIGFAGDLCADLMYDLPGQTYDDFQRDLDILVNEYKPDEADLFGTVYLPYRPLHRMVLKDKLAQPGNYWDLLKMREYGYDFMLSNGYYNTIAETFSKRNERTQYQTAHCARQDIVGIGCAARGNLQDMVSINPESVEQWMKNIDDYGASTETLQPIERDGVLDRIMVMFPRYKVLEKKLLESFNDVPRYKPAMKILQSHIKAGLVDEWDDRYTINKLGIIWHGNLQTDFMKHTMNFPAKMLLKCISAKESQFGREKRFGSNVATKYILGNLDLYPLLMK